MASNLGKTAMSYFEHSKGYLSNPKRALLVGVFQNQPLEYILEQQKLLDLDIVQFHGSEPVEWASLIPVPVIKSFSPADHNLGIRGYHAIPLLDSGAGGSGTQLDLNDIKQALKRDPSLRIMLAGGLNANNVRSVLGELGEYSDQVVGVDVSSGVEVNGEQSIPMIREFASAVNSY